MSYDRQQLKITASGFIGVAPPGTEIWSWGLHSSGAEDFDALAALAALDLAAVDEAVHVFHQSAGAAVNSDANYDTLKVAALGVDGAYLTDARTIQSNGATGYSGIGITRNPNQIAMAISLRTVTNLGKATHGRFYVPLPSFVVNENGRIDPTARASTLAAALTMLNSINVATASGAEPSLLSLMSNVGTTGLRSRVVTRVLVGDVLDTMQSRRESLEEAYASATLD